MGAVLLGLEQNLDARLGHRSAHLARDRGRQLPRHPPRGAQLADPRAEFGLVHLRRLWRPRYHPTPGRAKFPAHAQREVRFTGFRVEMSRGQGAARGVPSPIRDIGYMARGLEPFHEVFAVKITIWAVTAPLRWVGHRIFATARSAM